MKAPYARTFVELLEERADATPLAAAALQDGRRITYAELSLRVRQVARLFHSLGVGRGDRIAALLDNRFEWLEACFAASAVGATFVPLSTFVKAGELDFLLSDCGAKVLVTLPRVADQDFFAQLNVLAPELKATPAGAPLDSVRFPKLRHVIGVGAAAPGMLRYDDVAGLPPLADLPPGERASPADTALILYTSGSTSHPKAVMLPHHAVIENGFNIGERQGLGPGDRVFLAPPLFWAYGAANALPAAFTHGAALVLQQRFEPGEALAEIERRACTAIYTLPAMSAALLSHPEFSPERVASLRTGLTIGNPQEVRSVAETLGVRDICNIYGSSETCGNCCVTDHRMPLDTRVRCQGAPLPGVRVRIVDPETGAQLPPETEGVVEVRGYLMSGYGGASAAQNEAAFTPDGYFRTGDVGKLTQDGLFVFVARGDELIKRAGINVSPAEVEAVLLSHPGVAQAGVVGAPDPVRGQAVVAFVVPVSGVSLSEQALDDHCRATASRYKVPDRILLRSDLPVTATGKLQRRALRDLALAELEQARS